MAKGEERRYVYLLPDGLVPTVVDSQVVTVLQRLAERGVVFDLFVYQFRAALSRQEIERRLAGVRQRLPGRVRLWLWPAPGVLVRRGRETGRGSGSEPAGPAGEIREAATGVLRRAALWVRGRLVEAWILACLLPAMIRRETIVVHARGGAMDLGIRLKRWYRGFRVLADFRGDMEAEFAYNAAGRGLLPESRLVRRESARIRSLDRRILAKADVVQCVSEALRRRLLERHGPPPGFVRVVPCVADEERFRYDSGARARLRSSLGLDGRQVLVYSGSMVAWQSPDLILGLWTPLRRCFPKLHLLLVTPDVQAARGLVEKNGQAVGDDITIVSAAYEDVAGYLSAADVGLLLREPHPLNEVASPTKFAEYVLCGLPVLLSRGIGDLDGIVEQRALGVVVNDHRDRVEVERKAACALAMAAEDRRLERAAAAFDTFALGARLDGWADLYRRL